MKRRVVLLIVACAALTVYPALSQSVTPPPLKSVNAEGLWSATAIYVGFDGGDMTGGGANFEMELGDSGKDALLFGAMIFSGSFDLGDFGEIDQDSAIFNAGYKRTLRASRIYADDGTVVDAQLGAAAFATASYMKTETTSELCFPFAGCREEKRSNDFTYAMAGIMADIPLGRHFSIRPHAEYPIGLDNGELAYGVDLAVLGGLTDSWELSLSTVLQALEDNDATIYTFTFTRKLRR